MGLLCSFAPPLTAQDEFRLRNHSLPIPWGPFEVIPDQDRFSLPFDPDGDGDVDRIEFTEEFSGEGITHEISYVATIEGGLSAEPQSLARFNDGYGLGILTHKYTTDFDGDGKADAILTGDQVAGRWGDVRVYLFRVLDSGPELTELANIEPWASSEWVYLDDLDGNGLPELIYNDFSEEGGHGNHEAKRCFFDEGTIKEESVGFYMAAYDVTGDGVAEIWSYRWNQYYPDGEPVDPDRDPDDPDPWSAGHRIHTKYDVDADGDIDIVFETRWYENMEITSPVTGVQVNKFTGADPDEGLDLEGEFLFAVNVSSAGAVGQIGDAEFTSDTIPGVTVTADQDSPVLAKGPDYGDSAHDDLLELVMNSSRSTSIAGGQNLTIAAEGLSPGQTYKLQLLFSEHCCDRGFEILVENRPVLYDFNISQVQEGIFPVGANEGVVVSYTFEAEDATLDVLLNGNPLDYPDTTPILQGFTVERVSGGVDPNDTDADGLPDQWELSFFASLEFGQEDDVDNDALPNRLELLRGTDPSQIDTDGDGFDDGWEVVEMLEPTDSSVPRTVDFLKLHYDFEQAGVGTLVINSAPDSADGLLFTQDNVEAWGKNADSPSPGGPAALFCNDTDGNDATYIDTQLSADEAGMNGDTDYTAMAWIKATAFQVGRGFNDNMVFGQRDGNALHHGIRDGQIHMGHWANDTKSGDTFVQTARWYHVAWRYQNGVQSIFVDGVLTNREAKGPLNNPTNILIGTSKVDAPLGFWNDRDFTGFIDDVRIYAAPLTQAKIVEISESDTDADGLPDPWETLFLKTLEFGPEDDVDADGLKNSEELALYTNPGSADSDGDGFDDGVEITENSSPTDSRSIPGGPGTNGGPAYTLWAAEQGLSENAGFDEDANGDGYPNSFHYTMGIPATAFIPREFSEFIPRIDETLFANRATVLFKAPINLSGGITLGLEESFDLLTWREIASKNGDSDWFHQLPNTVVTDSPVNGIQGVGISSTKNLSQSETGFYRLRVRSPGTPVVVLEVEPKSLQRHAFTLSEVRIENRTLLADVSYSGGCATHNFSLHMSPTTFAKTAPVQANLWLRHESNDDACDSIVSETLHFDLKPVLDLHHEQFGSDDEMILNIHGFFENEPGNAIRVSYEP